jgi:hypothetical protein
MPAAAGAIELRPSAVPPAKFDSTGKLEAHACLAGLDPPDGRGDDPGEPRCVFGSTVQGRHENLIGNVRSEARHAQFGGTEDDFRRADQAPAVITDADGGERSRLV